MPKRTPYEVLMLLPSATPEVITAVYRQLAKQHHPDHSTDGGALMAEINEAHAVLGNREKREAYDKSIAPRHATATPVSTRRSAPGAVNLKYERGSWAVPDTSETVPEASAYGEAGEPPPYPPAHGSVLSFGRYRGWSIGQVASRDRNYLEWLQRTMAGRTYAAELDTILRQMSA
ncbi:MAG: DnaJ domain-containing protein [Chloroflexota bacterium]